MRLGGILYWDASPSGSGGFATGCLGMSDTRSGWVGEDVLPAELLSCDGRLHPVGLAGVTSSSAHAAEERPGWLLEPPQAVQWGTHRAVGLMCAHISRGAREDARSSDVCLKLWTCYSEKCGMRPWSMLCPGISC